MICEFVLSAEELLSLMELMKMHEKYHGPEERAVFSRKQQELGAEKMPELARAGEQDWAILVAEVEEARERGVDPGSPEVQEYARRWTAWIGSFMAVYDHDPGIMQSMQRMYAEEGSENATRAAVSADPSVFMEQAFAAAGKMN